MLNKPLPIAWKKKALFNFLRHHNGMKKKPRSFFVLSHIYYIYILYIHIIYTVKRCNFRILGNFGFFNTLSLLALICVCGACRSFLLYALQNRLGPRFSSWFFWTLALSSRYWLSVCFKELLVPTRIALLNHIVHLNTVYYIVCNWTITSFKIQHSPDFRKQRYGERTKWFDP